jgi:hypothetical protein
LSSVRFTSLGFSWSLCAPRGSQHRPSLDFCHASVFVFLSSIASVLSQILGHGIRRISPGRGILLLILLRLCQFACRTFSQVLQAICFLLCRSSISIFPLWIVVGWKPVLLLSHQIKSLKDSWSKLFFRGSFMNTSTSCSVKYLRGDKLFFESIFVIDLSCGLMSTVPCFRYGF